MQRKIQLTILEQPKHKAYKLAYKGFSDAFTFI